MLFKILHGDPSNISTDITPFHEGWAYVTHDGFFYIDLNIGTIESPNNQRIKLNSHNAELLCGMSLDELRNEFNNQDIAILGESQSYTDAAIETVKFDVATQDAVVLHEAQAYADGKFATKEYVDSIEIPEVEKIMPEELNTMLEEVLV